MLAERPICFTVFFAQNALLLLGVWSHALEADPCLERYEAEGSSIVLPPGPGTEVLSTAQWKHEDTKVAEINVTVPEHRFSGRATMDKTNYSLIIKELKIKDSGKFTFISAGETQRPTYCIRLRVQEVLTSPTLTVINTTKTSNESCVVWTECGSKSVEDVSYRWTVNNGNYEGSRLQYKFKPQEGDIHLTCSVSNNVSEASASADVNCQSSEKPDKGLIGVLVLAVIGSAIIIIIVSLVFAYRRRKKAQSECNDELTVYAEIDDVTSNKVVMPCSLYDSVETKPGTVQPYPKAQTVYDQIQFSRMQH